MCKKKKECNREIDECIQGEIKALEVEFKEIWRGKFKLLLSCCGHDKYPKTFVVQNKSSGHVFEWFSGVTLSLTKRAMRGCGYYKKDEQGYYYIPELK